MEGPPPSDRLSPRSALLIVVFGVSMTLVNLGPVWVLTYHEAYFAEPAREMLRTGDWLIPRMAGVPSWQKPPGTHWMIAATIGLLHTESEWAVRLPSLICTILNALFVALLAARWLGDRAGRLAGLIQLTTFYSLFQGRLAEADMPLCASVSGAMLCLGFGTMMQDRPRWWPRLGYFLAAGISFLIKGPFGLALIGGSGFVLACVERRKVVWRFLFDPIGLLLLAAICLPWPILAYRADPSALMHWRIHNLDRFTGSYDGRRNPFFYAYTIPGILLPWTPLAIVGWIIACRNRFSHNLLWHLLACWTGVGLALVSASAWKHKHYPIPALPPMAIASAYALDRLMTSTRRQGRSPGLILGATLGLIGVGFLVLGLSRNATMTAYFGTFAIISGLGLGLSARWLRSARPGLSLASLFGTIWLIVVLTQSFVLPRHDLYRPLADLARRVNARTPEGTTIDLVEAPHPEILFYLRPPMRRFDNLDAFASSFSGDSVVVCSASSLTGLRRIGTVDDLDLAPGHTPMASARLRPERAAADVGRSEDRGRGRIRR